MQYNVHTRTTQCNIRDPAEGAHGAVPAGRVALGVLCGKLSGFCETTRYRFCPTSPHSALFNAVISPVARERCHIEGKLSDGRVSNLAARQMLELCEQIYLALRFLFEHTLSIGKITNMMRATTAHWEPTGQKNMLRCSTRTPADESLFKAL